MGKFLHGQLLAQEYLSYQCLVLFVSWFILTISLMAYHAKLFADDTSLFSVIQDVETSANEFNNDLYQINKWAFQW